MYQENQKKDETNQLSKFGKKIFAEIQDNLPAKIIFLGLISVGGIYVLGKVFNICSGTMDSFKQFRNSCHK